MGSLRDDRPKWPLLLAAAILFVVLRALAAGIPLERDEGEYAYIAQRMLHGEVPYRDAFDQKPPGVFAAYLLPVALFGTSVVGIHLWLALWTAATAAFVYLIARRLEGDASAAWAVLVFALISVEPRWLATAANTELFMILPATASVWAALKAGDAGHRKWWIASGALAAAACLFKQVAATNFVLLALLAFTQWRAARPRRPVASLCSDGLALAGGSLAAALPVVVYFAATAAWRAFVDCVFVHNAYYAGLIDGRAGMNWLFLQVEQQAPSLALLWLLSLVPICTWTRGRHRVALVLGAWLALSAVGVSAGFWFRNHYFIQLAPPLAVGCGIAASRALARLAGPTAARRRAAVAWLLAAALLAPPLVANAPFWLESSNAARSRRLYGAAPFAESAAIAARIDAVTDPTDSVYIHGSEPQILFHAKRRSATRYIFVYPLLMNLEGVAERQVAAFDEIRRSRPRYVVLSTQPDSLLRMAGTSDHLDRRVNEMISAGYYLDGVRYEDGNGFHLAFGEAAVAVAQAAQAQGSRAVDLWMYARN